MHPDTYVHTYMYMYSQVKVLFYVFLQNTNIEHPTHGTRYFPTTFIYVFADLSLSVSADNFYSLYQ